jgi:acyl-CoA thioester hydrolase
MSEFEHVVPLAVRLRDLDPQNHVNNAVYGTYLEQARVDYLDTVLPGRLEDRNLVLASMTVDFQRPILREDDLAVALGTTALGESSFTMAYEVRGNGDVVATAETTQVHLGADGSPAPLPESWRAAIADYEPSL